MHWCVFIIDDLKIAGHHGRLTSRSSRFHTQIHEAFFDAKKTLIYKVSGPRIYEPIMTESASICSEAQKEYSQTCSKRPLMGSIESSLNIGGNQDFYESIMMVQRIH